MFGGRRKLGRHEEENGDVSERLKQLEARNAELESTINAMQNKVFSPIPRSEPFVSKMEAPKMQVEAEEGHQYTCCVCRKPFNTKAKKLGQIRDTPADVTAQFKAHAISPDKKRFWYVSCSVDCTATLDAAISGSIKAKPLYSYGQALAEDGVPPYAKKAVGGWR